MSAAVKVDSTLPATAEQPLQRLSGLSGHWTIESTSASSQWHARKVRARDAWLLESVIATPALDSALKLSCAFRMAGPCLAPVEVGEVSRIVDHGVECFAVVHR